MAETFPITIMGQKFLLKGNFEKEYIQQVESYINQKIEEVKKEGGAPDSYNLMILVALNLVDECLQKEQKIKKIMEDVEKNTNHLMKIIESRI